ncbi:MAG: helix-turn-helix transcriptional regulator [Desulfovibrio sp.]|nr:helix-turn-helix transcriptional regulator [Desulfovibrio sp.]
MHLRVSVRKKSVKFGGICRNKIREQLENVKHFSEHFMNKKIPPTPFGERLKKIRGRMSQAAFAASIGITQRAVVNYETGGRLPKGTILRKICEQYGINEDWLLTGTGAMAAPSPGAERAGVKTANTSAVLNLDSGQDVGNKESGACKTANLSAVLPQELTARCLRLADENAALLRENGDLRVEVERLRHQLEQTKEAGPADDALFAKLVQENKDLRARLKAFERAGVVAPPMTDIAQNGLPEQE